MSELDQIESRILDCQTYNFGMRNADKLAHEDAPYLLTLARKQAAALERVEKVRREFFELSNDSDWTEQTRAAYRDACRAILTALEAHQVSPHQPDYEALRSEQARSQQADRIGHEQEHNGRKPR